MKIFNNIGITRSVELTHAILVYSQAEGHEQATKLATVHPVQHGILGPGSFATVDAVRSLAGGLMGAGGNYLLPANVLSMSFGQLIWHCAPARRQMWFQPHEDPKDPKDKKRRRAKLKRMSGEQFPQPHLIFSATSNGFFVFALKCTGRPTLKTRLFHAPYWNVNEQGRLCVGSTQFPKEFVPSLIPQFEAAFYQSRFTHATMRGQQTRTPFMDLWPSLLGKRSFPQSELRAASAKLGDFLK